jgi:hypothetical protein
MGPRPSILLDGTKPANELWPFVSQLAEPVFLVILPHQPPAQISFGDLRHLVEAGDNRPLLKTEAVAAIPYLHPDEDLEDALPLATRYSLIPVVNRADLSQILGVLNLAAVMDAYRKTHEDFPAPY